MTELTGDGQVSWEGYVWRGCATGGLGGLALFGFVSLYNWWQYATTFSAEVLAFGAIFIPVAGLLMGSVVGVVIWKCNQKMVAEPTAMVRLLIGIGVVAVVSLVSNPGPVPSTLVVCVFLGGLPGLASRNRRFTRSKFRDAGEGAIS